MTTEWADELVGATLNVGPDRLDAAGLLGKCFCREGFEAAYGRNCILARRLIERGVRFV
jgi:hypothetical protein